MRKNQKILAAATLAMCAGSLFGAPDKAMSRSLQLVQKLNEMKMYNFSEMYLNKAITENADDADLYRSQLAETYLAQGKVEDAKTIIGSIPDGSQYYMSAQIVLGKHLYMTGKLKEAYPIVLKVYDYVKSNPNVAKKSVSPGTADSYLQAIAILLDIYRKAGKTEQVNEVTQQLLALTSEDGQVNEREQKYFQILMSLDTAESLKKRETAEKRHTLSKSRAERMKTFNGRAKLANKLVTPLKKSVSGDWESVVVAAILNLEDITWGGQDTVTAFACAATARAYVLLGRYDDALREIKKYRELFNLCDDGYRAENNLKDSPGALAKQWEAYAYYYKAKEAYSDTDKVKALKGAFVNFGKLLKNYGAVSDAGKMYNLFIEVSDQLATLAPDLAATVNKEKERVPVPATGTKSESEEMEQLVSAKTEQDFENKLYADVISALYPVWTAKRLDRSLPPVLEKLGMAYANSEQGLEALAVADYAANIYPKSPYTPVLLANMGGVFWQNKNAEDAVYVYELFMRVDPSNQNASKVATFLANYYFKKGESAAKEANQLQGEAKAERIQKVYEIFREAVKKYKYITDNYSFDKKLSDNAYLNMAASYATIEEFQNAADAYRAYFAGNPENTQHAVQAKLSLADNMYKVGAQLEKKAKTLKEEAYAIPAVAEAPKDESAAEVAASSREGKLKEVEKVQQEAVAAFQKGVEEIHELCKWLSADGKYADEGKSSVGKKTLESGLGLLPWLYDGAGDKKQSVKEFDNFIKTYPQNKSVPKCMMRMGVLFTEMGDNDNAGRILMRLSTEFKDTQEGKNAKFYLARSLYNNGSYEKAVSLLNEIFASKELTGNLSTGSLRWIASNVFNCGGQKPPDAAKVSLQASGILLTQLNKPVLSDWFGTDRALELQSNPKELQLVLNQLKQKVRLDAGQAAYYAGNYLQAVKYYDEILKADKNTPYFYEVNFGRADAQAKLKQYRLAMEDLNQISLRASTSGYFANYYKALCRIGEMNMEWDEGGNAKAYASFNMAAASSFLDDDAHQMNPGASAENDPALKEKKAKDKEESRGWIEYAIYKAACCAALLNKQEEASKLQTKYRKYFPTGRFIQDIDKLPKPQAGNTP